MPEKPGSEGCFGTKHPQVHIQKIACTTGDDRGVEPVQNALISVTFAPSSISTTSKPIPQPEDASSIKGQRTEENQELVHATGAPPAPPLDLGPEYGYVVPDNFALVWEGVYRSSFPKEESFEFIRRLGLKSILTLFPEGYPEKNAKFMSEAGIHHFQIGMPGNKEPFVNIPKEGVCAALKKVLDRQNHPILIHCNKGKHRTGCVVGCLRKIQKWGLTLIFDEYRRHSHPKSRALDQQFIELFDDTEVMEVARENGWLPKHHNEDH